MFDWGFGRDQGRSDLRWSGAGGNWRMALDGGECNQNCNQRGVGSRWSDGLRHRSLRHQGREGCWGPAESSKHRLCRVWVPVVRDHQMALSVNGRRFSGRPVRPSVAKMLDAQGSDRAGEVAVESPVVVVKALSASPIRCERL